MLALFVSWCFSDDLLDRSCLVRILTGMFMLVDEFGNFFFVSSLVVYGFFQVGRCVSCWFLAAL